MSFNMQVPSSTSIHHVEWSDCRGHGQACYSSAAHPQDSKAVPEQKSWEPQLVIFVHSKWHTDTIYEIDLVKAQSMGLNSFKHSVLLLFTSETFQQNVLQVADCLTKINKREGSIS